MDRHLGQQWRLAGCIPVARVTGRMPWQRRFQLCVRTASMCPSCLHTLSVRVLPSLEFAIEVSGHRAVSTC